MMRLGFDGSPYGLDDDSAEGVASDIREVDEQVALLRGEGVLTQDTLLRYYGDTRYNQVAESNAIEGSTLSAGETELAILKGVTLTGHDPAYVRDAQSLNNALTRIAELAADRDVPTDLEQLREIHGLILEGRPSAGLWRREPVRISGSEHRPPKTLREVSDAMDKWEAWSLENASAPAVFRAAVLHAWLVHIHPFIDGNGRTARAVTTLELVRAGYPPLVIKNTDRDRYIAALRESDFGGNIGPFLALVLDKSRDALTGLKLAARKMQGYDEFAARVRQKSEQQLRVWNTANKLLAEMLEGELADIRQGVGVNASSHVYEEQLDLEQYLALCDRRPISRSWSFEVKLQVPGAAEVRRLAWIGYRSDAMLSATGIEAAGPSIYWSLPSGRSYPPWQKCDPHQAPAFVELTIHPGKGDSWHVLDEQGVHSAIILSDVVEAIAKSLLAQAL